MIDFFTYRCLPKLLYLLLVSALTSQKIIAQEQVIFDHLTTEDGLSQSDINGIHQDRQGFMWFATHDGLNKYDGYGFTVYNPNPNKKGSISSNLVFNIVGDARDNLWIGTTGGGLNYFDKTTEKFITFKHLKEDKSSLSNDYISTILKDHKERLWIATNAGLNMLDLNQPLDKPKFHDFDFEPEPVASSWDGQHIYTIFENSKNQLFVGGVGGLFKRSRDQNGDIYFKCINAEMNLPKAIVRSIAEDKEGRLIVGTEEKLFIQERKGEGKLLQIAEGNINAIVIDDNQNIWCGTNKGLLFFNNSSKKKLPEFVEKFTYNPLDNNSISKNIIKSIAIDKTGIVWVGTNGGGINKFDPKRKRFDHIRKTLSPKSLSYDKIRSFFEDSNGTLWVGTEGGGLNMLTQQNDTGNYDQFKVFNTIQKTFAITEIQRDSKKILLIGAEGVPSLFELDITNPNSIEENDIKALHDNKNSVFALLNDTQKNVWIGRYEGGLTRWIPLPDGTYQKDTFKSNEANANSISSDIIRSIFEDSKGNIWCGTANGLCKLSYEERRKQNPKFEVFKNIQGDEHSLNHNYILAIFESKSHEIWVGTFGGGVSKFVPGKGSTKGSFESITEADGLPNNVIKGILQDDNANLWFSTNNGLSCYNTAKKEFKNYDVNDGLQNNEFQELAALKRKNGEMLFGGINGFNAFYPENIKKNMLATETVITNFSIFNKPVNIDENFNKRVILEKPLYETEKIKLKHWENSFSFEFAALHYAAPQKNQFAYMLEGFDSDWTYTSSNKRFANYTNLEPGEYTLKVKASNNDDLWDETPSSIQISIVPPFWQTIWAYLIYAVLGGLLLIAYRKFTIIKTTKKHSLELEHLEKERYEEMQQMKLEFFTNISHEFRTPLTLIKGPLEYLQKKGDQISNEKAKQQYNLMQKNADYLMRLVNQLLDFRKMRRGKKSLVMRYSNIAAFISEVGEPFQFTAHKQSIDFEISAQNNNLLSWFDHEVVEKIINNLLSNALKFTPEFGKITVEISQGDAINSAALLPLENDPSNYIIIQVKDSGSGIPKENVAHIFERFYVEQDKSKKNLNGAGIGLSFVKDLIALHQGKIKVVSEPHIETNFSIALPMHRAAYENIPEITLKEESESDYDMRTTEAESFAVSLNDEILDDSLSNNRSKLPVLLIVDDNADIRSFIKHTLEDEYTIHEAENGKQGLEMAVSLLPNIILTDIVMPTMDGFELCEKVKTTTATSHIPVLMITAKSSQESELKALQNGADDYIRKPFDIELLELKLTNIVKQREDLRRRFNREVTVKPKEVTVTSTDQLFLQQAIDIVEKHMTNTEFNVEMMVKEMGHSRSNLYLKFKEITGLSSSEFIRSIRLKRAMQLFDQSDFSVKEIMYMTGFSTASYFSKCFKKQFGLIPSEYVAKRKAKRKSIKVN